MTNIAGETTPKTVAIFATCVSDIMLPKTVSSTAKLLKRLGCRVVLPKGQTYCGQMSVNTGYFPEALPSVKAFLTAFKNYDYIVGPSGSCIGAVWEQHEMLAVDAGDMRLVERARQIRSRVFDISEFIVNVLGTTDVGAYLPHEVTYHASCHSLRVAEVGSAPIDLLCAVRGIDCVEVEDMRRYCGFGGTFSLKNSDVSIAMARDKANHILDTGADYVTSLDNTCLMNFGGLMRREKMPVTPTHLVDLLVHRSRDSRRDLRRAS